MLDAIKAMLAPLEARVGLMVGRAVLRAVADSGTRQRLQIQILADEPHDDVERVQQYGYTSVPLPGAECVVVAVGGNRDHGLVIAVDDQRYRLVGLEGGEVAVYDDQGQKVHLTRGGIVIDGAGKPITIQNAPTVSMDGDLQVGGSVMAGAHVTAGGDIADQGGVASMAEMRRIYNAHNNGANTTTPTPTM